METTINTVINTTVEEVSSENIVDNGVEETAINLNTLNSLK